MENKIDGRIKMKGHTQGIYEKYIKRPQDFCLALFALMVLSPLLLVLAILVRCKMEARYYSSRPVRDETGRFFTYTNFAP